MAATTLNQLALRPALNLADVVDKAVARMNLGLGTAAQRPFTDFEPASGCVFVHKLPGVTGSGTTGDPYVWDGTGIVAGWDNALVSGYWTLTGTIRLVSHYTALVCRGFVKATYTGSGDAIHVHTSAAGDPDTAEDDTHVTLFQRVENLWLHVNGSASGSAVAGNGIDIDQSHNCLVRNVRVSGRWANAFYVGNVTNCELDHCISNGSDPLQYNWTLADSPDCSLRLGRRAGNSFAAQNITVISPWFRFSKQYGIYSDAGDFGTMLIGGQVGDCGIHPVCYAAFAENLTMLGVDTEFGAAPTVFDADNNPVAYNLTGRGHRIINGHTFGTVWLNDSQAVTFNGGRSIKVWFQSSTACRVEDTFLIGANSRTYDAGSSAKYYVRTRADQPYNATVGFGEFDVSPNRSISSAITLTGSITASGNLAAGTGATGQVLIGNYAADNSYGSIFFGNGTPDGTNYALAAHNDALTTLLNGKSGISVRINNVPVFSFDGTGLVFAATATAPTNTATPSAWAAVKAGATTYKLPLYQ